MAKKKQKKAQTRKYAPDEVNENGEYIKIGGSPVPGLTLRHVLSGNTGKIQCLTWSPDGRILATGAQDGEIRLWNNSGYLIGRCAGHTLWVNGLTWSPDSKILASGSGDTTIRLWNVSNQTEIAEPIRINKKSIHAITWSPDGKTIAVSSDNPTLHLISVDNNFRLDSLEMSEVANSTGLTWSSDNLFLYQTTYSYDNNGKSVKIDLTNQNKTYFVGHTDRIQSIVCSPNGKILASASYDKTIKLWRTADGKLLQTLEGHSRHVHGISFSPKGELLVSKSCDNSVRIWHGNTGKLIAILNEKTVNESGSASSALSFGENDSLLLATLGDTDTIIRVWQIDLDILLGDEYQKNLAQQSVKYTTAKLVLVGDSGVGKTGLGWRLAHNEFKEHSSTHGQQFWVVPELKKTRDDGTECEAVLWDLAGQPDYRLVHSLYLDDVDTALVLFDPTNRQEPLAGVDFWLNQLKGKDKKLSNSILVGARTDRGTSTLTDEELRAFCERNRISGGYVPTSASQGDGLPELMEKLKSQIPWDEMTTTVTTVTFKKIKEFVLALKEKTDRKNVLVQPNELRDLLQATDKDWEFSDAEMMTAVGHLETHGYVKVIHSSNGDHSILLAPDILANLASSIVLEARRNQRGLGVLEESRLLRGDYPFAELNNLSEDEQKILLDAAAVLFLERNICFRETFNQQTFLVFPSLINEKRPADETIKTEEGASYRVKGAVENIYASLVVLLGYTNTFVRTHQWQNQAQYELGEGETCGFIQAGYGDGGIELVLYYGAGTPESVRLMFRGLFERFLSRRELDISRYQPVKCPKCGALLARNVVLDQLSKGKNFSFCHEDGEKVLLPSPEPLTRLSPKEEVVLDAQQAIAKYRTSFEAALVRVKGLLRDQQDEEKKPTCFISYAWGTNEHQRWVMQLAKDLRNAGIDILLDRWNVVPGANLDRYIEQIMETDFVVVVGTPGLVQKYNSTSSDPVVTAELEMLNLRLRQPNKYGHTILPILVEGNFDSSFTPQLQKLVYVDFKQTEIYFRQLFDTIWRLYNLPFDNPLLEELQASMTPQQR